jgi:cold-inducible RNA-binding protein
LELYSQYGDVTDVYIPRNKETGEPRGFAFVTLDEENATKAIEATNGMEYMGRQLAVSLPLPPGEKSTRSREGTSFGDTVQIDASRATSAGLQGCGRVLSV